MAAALQQVNDDAEDGVKLLQEALAPGIGLPENPAPRRPGEPLRAGDFYVGATQLLARVAACPGDPLNASDIRHAEGWFRRGEQPLTDEQRKTYTGGELSPIQARRSGAWPMELHNTVTDAHLITAEASRERLELARDAGTLEMGLDAAETINAQNSLEKMLAHQMAALHGSTMKMVTQLNTVLNRLEATRYSPTSRADEERERASMQAARLAGSVARMSLAYQQGLQTVHKLRSGGQQVVTVQHIHQQVAVQAGGQAVVTGQVRAPEAAGGGGSENER
jgi:hypothetical protein